MAALLDAAVTVVETVDGGVELVMGPQGLQDQRASRPVEKRKLVDGDHGLSRGCVESARVARPVRQHKAAILPDFCVVVFAAFHHVRDVFADQIVVLLETGPVGTCLVPYGRPRQAGDDGNLGKQARRHRFNLAEGRVHCTDRVFHGHELLPRRLPVDLAAAHGRQNKRFLAHHRVRAVQFGGDLDGHLRAVNGGFGGIGVRDRPDQIASQGHEELNAALAHGLNCLDRAGASPIRGHSNVQGDRTMGIWEQMPPSFMDALGKEFGFEPPIHHGADAVKTIQSMREGGIKFFMALGGNLVGAIADTNAAEAAMHGTEMTVQISTKLNRSHAVVGKEALILPTMGRSEIDRQASGEQFVSVEDTVCAVHPSFGKVEPVAPGLLSEVAIVSRLARATIGDKTSADWAGFEKDYDLIREHISHVVEGCEDYNTKIRKDGGFVLPNGPRDSRTFHTPTGKAVITVNKLAFLDRPAGTLILQTLRSHDQFNTTIYGFNDRYRGIKKGRHVVFVNPEDLAELGLKDGQRVDVHGVHDDGAQRVLRNYRVVSYPSAKGCAAAYYPEANVLVPLDNVADGSNTPVSKAVIVRLEPAQEQESHPTVPDATPAGV